ncbi:MAG: hypothetical protein JO072_17135 [Parafilimonas sp.]|nr:hypothetical protein [Parafilimonas sp.]
MKTCFKFLLVMSLMNIGCSAQKNSLISNVDVMGIKQPMDDSLLEKLQQGNDLIIAFAVENFAWIRSMDFHIITQKNNEWQGYTYHKNLMKNNAGSPTSINKINVDKAACDALINYITENKAWTIPGDSVEDFCKDGNKNCNINDASGLRLLIITKKGAVNPYYYAPDFYEKCCPDKERGLFLSITKKIQSVFGAESATDQ